jgi:hypothetical protein
LTGTQYTRDELEGWGSLCWSSLPPSFVGPLLCGSWQAGYQVGILKVFRFCTRHVCRSWACSSTSTRMVLYIRGGRTETTSWSCAPPPQSSLIKSHWVARSLIDLASRETMSYLLCQCFVPVLSASAQCQCSVPVPLSRHRLHSFPSLQEGLRKGGPHT